MNERVQIEDRPSLARDIHSRAIINIDDVERRNYINKSRIAMDKNEEMNEIKHDVDELKKNINDIKIMLLELIRK